MGKYAKRSCQASRMLSLRTILNMRFVLIIVLMAGAFLTTSHSINTATGDHRKVSSLNKIISGVVLSPNDSVMNSSEHYYRSVMVKLSSLMKKKKKNKKKKFPGTTHRSNGESRKAYANHPILYLVLPVWSFLFSRLNGCISL